MAIGGLAWLAGAAVRAQSGAPQLTPGSSAGQAQLPDCYRALTADSAALYYNGSYQLTPVACATVRRLARLEADGSFHGEVRDYDAANGRLLLRQHYQHGRREGAYEAFYANGQRRLRGTYAQGQPSGEWQWWYAGGQPWQTLRRDPQAPQGWRFLAYADSTGAALLTGGNGRWQQVDPRARLRYEGAVRDGLPEGEWTLFHLGVGELLATETFEKGAFRKGRSLAKVASGTYRDESRLRPLLPDPSQPAERYQLGQACAPGRLTVVREARRHDYGQPKPAGDAGFYLRLLLQKVQEYPFISLFRLNQEFEAPVLVDVDPTGKLTNIRSGQPDVQRLFVQVLPPLGRWSAATVDGQPSTGHLQFKLHVVDQHWEVQYRVTGIDLPPAAATP